MFLVKGWTDCIVVKVVYSSGRMGIDSNAIGLKGKGMDVAEHNCALVYRLAVQIGSTEAGHTQIVSLRFETNLS